ncbi:MAG: protein kinase [Polyangiaceae bacterium]
MAGPLPEIIAGRYRPIGEIGKGGMGSVLLVEHVNTGDRLAMKTLHKSFGDSADMVERFKREARAAAKIKSDHVVRITDADVAPELGGLPFMVMEVLNGEDVRNRLANRGPFPKEEVVHILSQVARALDRAHQMGIVHRDIKPENIFLHTKEDGVEIVKLLDFGISKMLGETNDEHATQAGMVLGTPTFMAPEQVRTGEISGQTDMWAVGMVAYKLLVGKNYWPKLSTGELMASILVRPMELPTSQRDAAHLGGGFDAWFMRSCDREPTKRWSSVTEQIGALADALRLARPSGLQPIGPLPAQSSEASVPMNVAQASAAPSGAHAVTNGPVTTGTSQAPPSKTNLTIPLVIVLATLFLVVAYGAQRLMKVRVASPTSATAQTQPNAPIPTAAATLVVTAEPSAVPTAAPVVSATSTARASASSSSTHAHPQSTAEKAGSHAAPAKTEDPWAR